MATTTRTLSLNIQGVQQNITSIGQLQTAVSTLENDLNNATFGSAEFIRLTEETRRANVALAAFQAQTQATAQAANQAGQSAQQMGGDFDAAFGLGSLAAGETGEALGKLQGGFSAVKSGLDTVGKGFGTLKGAIASTGIGILLLAFGALVTYFTQTQAGIDFINRKTAALQAVFSLVSEKVAQFGKFLFDAFSNPKKSLEDLVDAIQNNLVNRLKSFTVILDGIRNADFTKVVDGVAQFATGITDATAKARGLGNAMLAFGQQASAAASEGERIADVTRQIAVAERELGVAKAESEARIAKLKLDAANTEKGNGERLKAAQEAAALENKFITAAIGLQDRKIANLLAEQKLKKNLTAEDRDAEAELRKQRAETQKASLDVQNELQATLLGIRAEAKAKREADAAAEKATSEKNAADRKALTEKMVADEQAARAIGFDNQKVQLAAELEAVESGSRAALDIIKRQKALETVLALQAIDDKYQKAGEKEKAALLTQKALVTAEGNRLQTKLDTDFAKNQVLVDAGNAKARADVKLAGLKEGNAAYYDALLDQQAAEEALALGQLGTDVKNEDARTLVRANGVAARQKIVESATAALREFNLGTSILSKVFGVDRESVDKTKQALAASFTGALALGMEYLASANEARSAALEAQQKENDDLLEAAKSASDDLKTQLNDSASRVDELESSLKGTRGIERQAILDQLEEERKRNAAIAKDKQKEDGRIRQAEAQKLELEKKKTAEQEKQAKQQQVMNALQAVSAALGATEVAVSSVKAIAKAGEGGKFGFDNIAYILAATLAMAGAFQAVKTAAKGFAAGGFTGIGSYERDHTGHRVAGVVHEGEWVAPKWMVESPKFQTSIHQLEAARSTGNGYAAGGFGQPPVNTTAGTANMDAFLAMQAELISLRKDTIALASRPSQFVVTQYDDHVTKNTEINDYFLG
ncbi:hypothetical protein I2I05_08575 [Hymenobacter sp. BT683]|uniref:Bacteriophage tail tape measure N-terminal domain-containing protein n=1 Tax=Hymenobacter jeongseonensis TaxID=2791027 RepID=A0ABS0IGG7_9BACT|nr:hypothetical protein [Hymenobacter jeongseonensis]MBF9237451.1 hypothetical protein [Hymenobacter jeongseonensis]